jgi:molecular chaperone DnaK (HSP70)
VLRLVYTPLSPRSTTMNMDEAVAKGAAFRCATVSPLFQVKEVQYVDYLLYPIKLSYDLKDSAAAVPVDGGMDVDEAVDEAKPTSGSHVSVFPAGAPYPSAKSITFKSAEV